MDDLPPPTAPTFLRVTSDILQVQVLTRVEHWYAHYDATIRQKRRCGGTICRDCDAGRRRELIFVLGVDHGATGRRLLEFRERHRGFLEQLRAERGGSVGCLIHVYKRGHALNSPVEAELRGRKAATEWDIRLLVESLGVGDSPSQENPETLPQVAGLDLPDLR